MMQSTQAAQAGSATGGRTIKTLGFVGMGNMAQALARGFILQGKVRSADVFAFAPHQDKLKRNAQAIGFSPCSTTEELMEHSDVVIVACKPYQIEAALAPIKGQLSEKSVLSVAAGWSCASFKELLGEAARIQCIMPNVAASVAEGVFLFEEEASLLPDELAFVQGLFGALGRVVTLPSHLMKIGMAISGCAPAFMDMILEAYADAAVKWGLPRDLAYDLASQTMLGAAKLQLATRSHPGVLKDAVCSPGGTTIKGVASLEASGLRGACISSVDAIMNS